MSWRACALVIAACGDPTHVLPDAPACTPMLGSPWLRPLVHDAVAQLAAAPRATVTERDAARTWLTGQLAQLGWTPQTQTFANGANVYASIPSTTASTQQIVVGAHFDTVTGSPGANDNATGVAVVLAVARYLQDTSCRGPNVAVAFFDLEETGLYGSRAFAQMVTDVAAVHTIDQVGWDSDGDHRFELELPTAVLAQEYLSAAAVVGVQVTATATQGTDHQAFRDLGLPAIGLTEEYTTGDTSPYRHTAADTAATVNDDYLVLAAQLLGQVVITEVATP